MPDATEWLVEYFDSDTGTNYEHIEERDDAIAYLRQLVGQGRTATLYQLVPFEVQIGVTVKAPRKRRKTPPPAEKPGSDTPTGPGNGEAGELKGAGPGTRAGAGEKSGDSSSEVASPVFDCEARFDGDPPCTLSVTLDPVTKGHFCLLHMVQMTESARREMHRRHASRNRPVRVAHAG